MKCGEYYTNSQQTLLKGYPKNTFIYICYSNKININVIGVVDKTSRELSDNWKYPLKTINIICKNHIIVTSKMDLVLALSYIIITNQKNGMKL